MWAGYEEDSVLENINLSVWESDFIGLIGPEWGRQDDIDQGAAGAAAATAGRNSDHGQAVEQGRAHIGYVPQVVVFDRDFPISVWEVALMGRLGKRRLFRRYSADDEAIVAEFLRRVETA